MKREIKVVKLNEEEILTIVGEYFNFSGKKYVKKGVKETHLKFCGTAGDDLRAICVLVSQPMISQKMEVDLDKVDEEYDFTDGKSVDLK